MRRQRPLLLRPQRLAAPRKELNSHFGMEPMTTCHGPLGRARVFGLRKALRLFAPQRTKLTLCQAPEGTSAAYFF